jgi:hypothetical protein
MVDPVGPPAGPGRSLEEVSPLATYLLGPPAVVLSVPVILAAVPTLMSIPSSVPRILIYLAVTAPIAAVLGYLVATGLTIRLELMPDALRWWTPVRRGELQLSDIRDLEVLWRNSTRWKSFSRTLMLAYHPWGGIAAVRTVSGQDLFMIVNREFREFAVALAEQAVYGTYHG